MRFCGACGDLSSARALHCGTCGKPLLMADALLAEARKVKTRKARGKPRRCAYCGGKSYGEACVAHRDLLALERRA